MWRARSLMLLVLMSAADLWEETGGAKHDSPDAGYLSPVEAAKVLSSGLLKMAKKHKGNPLPPRVDLILVLDSSKAVSNPFPKLKMFANNLIDEFSVSSSTTRVALVLCSSSASLPIALGQCVNRECTKKAVNGVSSRGGSRCDLKHSLQLVQRLASKSHHDTRHKALPVVFIVTSGSGHTDSRALSLARRLHQSGADMYVLSIGSPVRREIQKLVPANRRTTHSMVLRSFVDLGIVARHFKGNGFHIKCFAGNKHVFDECKRKCLCSSSGELFDCYRVRKEFTTMTIPERKLYIHTFKTASLVKPYKTFYDKITRYHPRLFEDVHRLKYFFPWHRWYILEFENFLRNIDCRVTLPFWQWSDDVTNNRLWRSTHYRDVWFPGPHGLGGNGLGNNRCVLNGPFRKGAWKLSPWVMETSCLTREFNDCFRRYLPKRSDVEFLLQTPLDQFEKFEDNVRGFMHNDFHNAIGGVMSLAESASAPEFWFHHCFLDKLWSDWQKRGYRFKHLYFHTVKEKLPGSGYHGTEFIDLSKQPGSIKVVYEQPDYSLRNNDKIYRRIKVSKPVFNCDGDDTSSINYRNRVRNVGPLEDTERVDHRRRNDDDGDDDDDYDDDYEKDEDEWRR